MEGESAYRAGSWSIQERGADICLVSGVPHHNTVQGERTRACVPEGKAKQGHPWFIAAHSPDN